MINAAIVGVSGYGGGELVRLLSSHPEVDLTYVVSDTFAGQPLSRAFPGLGRTRSGQLICQKSGAIDAALAADIIFLASESGAAMKVAGEILDLGKQVIDLSADFRIRDVDSYEKWYKIEHLAANLIHDGTVVYGLPEFNRDLIQRARLIANPGCFPTASILALAPLLTSGLINPRGIVIDAISGVSGAGRSKADLIYRYSEANEAVLAYGVGGVHRHVPEIEQELSACLSTEAPPIRVTFTPHLAPMTRGIHATCYARTNGETTTEAVLDAFHDAYSSAPFVVVREANDYPSTKNVYGSNFCHICAKVDPRTDTVIVTSVIDNLVKGAAGQAIQNMNLALGLPETMGLEAGGIWP